MIDDVKASPRIGTWRFAIVLVLAATAFVGLGIWARLSKSDWAAWVQAVGSVGAIIAAIWIWQRQHEQQARQQREDARQARRRDLSALLWTYVTVAEVTSQVVDELEKDTPPSADRSIELERLREKQRLLRSIPLTQYPDNALFIRSHELIERLQIAEAVVHALSTPRNSEVRKAIVSIVASAHRHALEGVTEATGLLVQCSTPAELDGAWHTIDARDKSSALTAKVMSRVAPTAASDAAVDQPVPSS